MLTWLSLSAYVFLLGAELNAELERQTGEDTTTGGARPRGNRHAAMANAPAPGVVPAAVDAPARPHGLSPGLVAIGGLATLRWGRPLGLALIVAAAVLASRGDGHNSATKSG
jgi:membrane protein